MSFELQDADQIDLLIICMGIARDLKGVGTSSKCSTKSMGVKNKAPYILKIFPKLGGAIPHPDDAH